MKDKLVLIGEQLLVSAAYAFVGVLVQNVAVHALGASDFQGGLAAAVSALLGKITSVSIFGSK